MPPFERLLRWLLVPLVLLHVIIFVFLLVHRLGYPFDLEWMEGGMLLHAQRIAEGQQLYGPPTLEFVPYLYTPLYPALLAALSKLFGLGYLLGRVLSVAALAVALGFAWRAARAGGAHVACAAAVVAAILASFPFVGGWYDLVRNDNLFLAFGVAGLYLMVHDRTPRGAALSALLVSISFFAKQTGIGFVAIGLWIALLAGLRLAILYVVLAAAALVVPGLALQRASHGWFWTWVWQAPEGHAFYARRAFLETPWTLARQAPAVWIACAAAFAFGVARRALRRQDLAWLLFAAGGVGMACLGFGKQWAYYNHYIPGVVGPLVALGVVGGASYVPRWLAPAALAIQLGMSLYDPRPYCPTPSERVAGERLLARIAAAPGDVFIPYHPFYPPLVGKRATLHRMGLLDAPGAGLGRPRGLDEALAEHRFALVILNVRMVPSEYPTLPIGYQPAPPLSVGVDSPRTFSGAPTWPLYVFEPRDREP